MARTSVAVENLTKAIHSLEFAIRDLKQLDGMEQHIEVLQEELMWMEESLRALEHLELEEQGED